ncbi:MAG: hypothetical protein RL653_425, partial [Pseudomonadota bacterium]
MWTDLLVIFSLVLVNGLFAGAEIATVTVRKTRIEQLLAEGRRSAHAILELRRDPERFLASVQVGITVVSAAAAAYGGDTLAERLVPSLAPWLGPSAHRASFVVVVGCISFLSLVLGELVPKSLALRAGESYALLVARPLLVLAKVARPLVWLLTKSSNAVLRLFGDKTSFTEARVSPDELKAMLEEASEVGSLHPRIGEIAARAMDLTDLKAGDVMVPRNRIVAVERAESLAGLRRALRESSHSRIPVFEGDIDHVVGYVSLREAFLAGDERSSLEPLVRSITFIPETMRAVDLLQTLQARGVELAIVVDEHGGTAGLLTREDLTEELLGEATANAQESTHGPEIVRLEDGSVLVSGSASVREVNR